MKPSKVAKPVRPSLAAIRRLRGFVKRPLGAPTLGREMAEHKRTEKELEEKLVKKMGI